VEECSTLPVAASPTMRLKPLYACRGSATAATYCVGVIVPFKKSMM